MRFFVYAMMCSLLFVGMLSLGSGCKKKKSTQKLKKSTQKLKKKKVGKRMAIKGLSVPSAKMHKCAHTLTR